MTDTAVAESETVMDEFPSSPVAEETLASNPDWRYLFVEGMPVRPPTDEEKASYAARYADGTWADLNDPAEPHVILPPSAEVAELTEIAAGALEALPAVDDETAAEDARRDAFASLARWSKGTRLADPEVARPDPDTEVVEGAVVDDPATTRFLEAFAEDPEGERDRAQPPPAPQVHHDTQVTDAPPQEAS